jgi:hypothetical protein
MLLTTIATWIYWEWACCVSSKDRNWKEILNNTRPFLNWSNNEQISNKNELLK